MPRLGCSFAVLGLTLLVTSSAQAADCGAEGTIAFQDGVPASGQFTFLRVRRSGAQMVTFQTDASGRFSVRDIDCGKYTLLGELVEGTKPFTVEVTRGKKLTLTLAGPSWTRTTGVDTTLEQDEEAAERLRREFLQSLSPDDWYVCYSREPDANGRKNIFERVVTIAWSEAIGQKLPAEAYTNCNTPAQVVPRDVGAALRRGLTGVLLRAWQSFGIAELNFLVARAPRFAGDGAEPQRSDEEEEQRVASALEASKKIVSRFDGDAASTFLADPPRLRAAKLARAAQSLMLQREWPAPIFLLYASVGRGETAQQHLRNFYLNADHADLRNWNRMSLRQRGEALRRMYVEMFRRCEQAATGAMSASELAASGVPGLTTSEYERVVREAFGPKMLERYRRASETNDAGQMPGYKAEDILTAAYAYYVAWMYVPLIAM